MLTETEVRAIKPPRYLRKVSDGGGLYRLVTPKGGRWWRYGYRFAWKDKAIALGTYPAVPLDRTRSPHEFARNLLAHGLDPAALTAAFGKHRSKSRLKSLKYDCVNRASEPSCQTFRVSQPTNIAINQLFRAFS
jgi:hypothetical protein